MALRDDTDVIVPCETPWAFHRELLNPPAADAWWTDRLPFGLVAPPPARVLFREQYFDSDDLVLELRGVRCRVRHEGNGRRLLVLDGWSDAPDGECLDITHRPMADVLQSDAPLVRRLRALLEPHRLAERLELQVDRRVGRLHWRRWPVARALLAVDHVHVTGTGAGTGWADLRLRPLGRIGPSLARIADALSARYTASPVLLSPMRRALQRAGERDAAVLAGALHPRRECVVLLVDGERIGLCRVTDGSESMSALWGTTVGEHGCRRVLTETFASSQAQVRCLGNVAPRPWRPALEIWMARRLPDAIRRDPRLEWLALSRAIALAGSPVLRDWRTLAALQLASQSELLREQVVGSEHPRPVAPELAVVSHASPDRMLDADESLLAFNERVLEMAQDRSVPPARQLGYLSIVAANLDEFFMVRIGALKGALHRLAPDTIHDSSAESGQLDAVRVRSAALFAEMYRTLRHDVLPSLAAQGASLVEWRDLSAAEREELSRRFDAEVRPRLVPLAASASHPFPHVPSAELSLALSLRERGGHQTYVAIMSVPPTLPRLLSLSTPGRWILIEHVICAQAASLFPGVKLATAHTFRVTRSADLRYSDAGETDVLRLVEDTVGRRPFLPVVRLEVERSMPADMRSRLLQELRFEHPDRVSDLESSDVVVVDGPLGLRGMDRMAAAVHCRMPVPRRSPFTGGGVVFDEVQTRDVLVHLPYDAFQDSVLRFLDEASRDSAVESIRMTLYRTSNPSPVVEALLRARAAGKVVVVFVELTARFDESRNIDSARAMSAAGIHVVYGIRTLKLHAKLMLVLRRDADGLRSYAYVGSGNFNPVTATFYTDVGLFTARAAVTRDVDALMNALAGVTAWPALPTLLVSPVELLPRLLALIQREISHARAGRPAGLRLKVNGLDEPELVEALYAASNAGVRVHLSVRGICTLRPGVPGLSEHVTVVSVLGEFLEHARILHVVNGGADEYFLGSADWRSRNLRRRVEVLVPVVDTTSRQRLDRALSVEQEDPSAWSLAPDGRWSRRRGADDPAGTQRRLLGARQPDAVADAMVAPSLGAHA